MPAGPGEGPTRGRADTDRDGGAADQEPAAELNPAERIGRLADLVVTGRVDADQGAALAAELDELLSRYEPAGPAEHDQAVEALALMPYRERSPFVGTANVRAPGMVLERVEAEQPTLRGRVVLNPSYSGPAGLAHGGVVIGLFDELFGSLATVVGADGAGVTATLDTRFRKPTPTGTELVFEARLVRRSSRRLKMEADCTVVGERPADGTCGTRRLVTATAEALMVIAR